MEKLFKEFESLKNDKERWLWVKDHQKDGIIVNLDNDDTFITIENYAPIEGEGYSNFEGYIGWSEGIFSLLEAMSIRAESIVFPDRIFEGTITSID